jgi:hypothetical protein
MRKAKLLYLIDRYEELLVNHVTGKCKRDYIGKVGNVFSRTSLAAMEGCTRYLYNIEFDDGARFCVDREQIEFVED